jgi:chromosomal replication initiation ATPase DnaA
MTEIAEIETPAPRRRGVPAKPPLPADEVAAVLADIAKRRRTTVRDICSSSRFREHMWCRQEAAAALREMGATMQEIGRVLNIHHSTVIYSIAEHNAHAAKREVAWATGRVTLK